MRMSRFAAFRSLVIFLVAIIAATLARGFDGGALSEPAASPTNIVIGFVGGFVGHDNPHHGPVQLAQRIRQTVPHGTFIRIFENRRRKQAYDAVVHLLDTNRDGVLSAEEKARARIVLLGQSWGAAAAVALARDLRREGVPVLLTVQVDSVAKLWQNDSVIPDNVAEAVNFYQPHGLIHGRAQIVAADPARTDILGNYRMDYRKDPVQCPQASWFDRVITPGHMQSECDPHLWSQIENMVRQRLVPNDTSAKTSTPASFETLP
jgi:pimeloyl-ACP methyl ester carboxylesterase